MRMWPVLALLTASFTIVSLGLFMVAWRADVDELWWVTTPFAVGTAVMAWWVPRFRRMELRRARGLDPVVPVAPAVEPWPAAQVALELGWQLDDEGYDAAADDDVVRLRHQGDGHGLDIAPGPVVLEVGAATVSDDVRRRVDLVLSVAGWAAPAPIGRWARLHPETRMAVVLVSLAGLVLVVLWIVG